MIDFKKGDEVEFFFDWSDIKYYGKVVVVRDKSCTVETVGIDNQPERVTIAKRFLNFC